MPSLAAWCAGARGGYAWWYIEAHDTVEGRYGLCAILFAGSVFSPFYAERLRRGEPRTGLLHPAVNLVLYERAAGSGAAPRQRLWAMNEYPPASLSLDERRICIGDSFIEYAEDGSARVELSEETTRFFGDPGPRIEVRMRLSAPQAPQEAPLELGSGPGGATHYWQPLVAAGDAEVELRCGPLCARFCGLAYGDHNFGGGRLEDAFSRWSWAHGVSEEPGAPRRALLLYRAERRDGGVTGLRISYAAPGAPRSVLRSDDTAAVAPASWRSRGFLWLAVPDRFSVGDARCERLRDGRLEDAPFYARYLARLRDPGGSYTGVGEYLDLDRFRVRALQGLLAFKTRQVPPWP